MPLRVNVTADLLSWAVTRSRLDVDALTQRFPRFAQWENGEVSPTLKQLEDFARATHAPIGYFFLPEPPEESLPIPDFRTMAGAAGFERASPDLLDTVFLCQQRQEWYRDFARTASAEPIPFVGSLSVEVDQLMAAEAIRDHFDFGIEGRGNNWAEAFRLLIRSSEERGVLVMVSGIVGNNTHRKLDPREFRGFALVDQLAPVIFVNGSDTKAAQIFTLVHEICHLWIGETGVSDTTPSSVNGNHVEHWCNYVAAEILVPLSALTDDFVQDDDLTAELNRLARRFKASTLVVLRRIYDAGYLDKPSFLQAYGEELERVMGLMGNGGSSGGDFYNTEPIRVSTRFATALIQSTLEGQTLYGDAFQMLGFKKLETFQELATRLGVA